MKNGITVFKFNVRTKVQNVSECLSGRYSLNHEHFVTKFGMVIQHHEAESCRHFVVVTIFKVKGSYSQNMTLSVILSELLIPWQPILV